MENNADLGDEVERIFLQYLNRRLGNSVRVLRGGHIYDYENNRSDQIDIIITPANALGFCPADTGDGKCNVMVDQVIAAISVTSRLTPDGFRKRMEELERIPKFKQKAENYPGLAEQAWPLTYIVGAECEDLRALEELWRKIGASDKPPNMILLLDSGYVMQRTLYPKGDDPDMPKRIDQLWPGEGIYAGIGLGWLEIQIAARNSWLSNQRVDWIHRLQKQLFELEQKGGVSPTYDQKREGHVWMSGPILGVLKWGWSGMWVHNQLFVNSLFVRETDLVVEATLTDPTKPIPKRGLRDYKFEPRWFKQGMHASSGDYCALEEWIDPLDREKHQRRVVVFDSRTGEEVTNRLTRKLSDCSELEQLNPILKPES